MLININAHKAHLYAHEAHLYAHEAKFELILFSQYYLNINVNE